MGKDVGSLPDDQLWTLLVDEIERLVLQVEVIMVAENWGLDKARVRFEAQQQQLKREKAELEMELFRKNADLIDRLSAQLSKLTDSQVLLVASLPAIDHSA